ncbi:hypothetical protein GOPIP_079_00260 [Gordonia polyisoprenivorans NBRC 16320 = JCM 10675]|uniref:Uncharacterized protein n=1 Tax=Gordonia polyisoprenivorans TaxID=84595 RepID=A0A846WX28_9ACTN|nr:DUF6361 family protein [Gordonia polyisoprenivorans]NKY04991.1 hypothetical protein [Gordonia polyisoprenivorans]QUD82559.1 hypothetical protein J8M97_23180 [Gordonia polyisoprenivorans]GAB25337.1 hypothetical protein GOPIP_079_00260 [Gordonia polyisoprenivorans NBRC 16320 = JCM 10675]
MSGIAWLDTSPADERRMREIVRLFSDTATLDDLGIGQVRDGLSDLMFPGTSTVHARPRYFLIIPWIFQRASAKASGTSVLTRANTEERKLIEVMRTPPAVDGMIGKIAGKTVRALPSRLYWAALQRYGILDDSKTYRWNMPIAPPPGFPGQLDGGLDLTAEEAEFLRERIMLTCKGSYLAYLLADGLDADTAEAYFPWKHPALDAAPSRLREIVEHARLFSLAINGATLLYNLLVAEKFDAVSAEDGGHAESYREALNEWADEVEQNRNAITMWDLGAFWTVVHEGRSGRPVGPASKIFVDQWLAHLRSTDAHELITSVAIRDMIAERERKNKGEHSRLNNERQIRNWGGASGAGRLTYRWFIVQRMLTDIQEGLAGARS